MGGSIYLYGNYIENDEPPRFDNRIIEVFKNFWDSIQSEMRNGNILSGHDISDGGFLGFNLIEMSIASNYGMTLYIESRIRREDYLFNEELGIIGEFNRYHSDNFIKYINSVFPMINAKLMDIQQANKILKFSIIIRWLCQVKILF